MFVGGGCFGVVFVWFTVVLSVGFGGAFMVISFYIAYGCAFGRVWAEFLIALVMGAGAECSRFVCGVLYVDEFAVCCGF